MLDVRDIPELDRKKGASTLERVRLEDVRDPEGPSFAAAYALLDSFFGPQGELEARETLQRFVRSPILDFGGGAVGIYHLVAVWAGDQLVGVRDCYVDIDAAHGVCVVVLSHSLVVPEWRRTGLAAVLRALPVTIARAALAERGLELPTIVAAEMEPVDPAVPETIVRMVAYGRSGFLVADPRRFRYSQPDFRELQGAAHGALPLLGVIRPVNLPPGDLPLEVALAYPRMFHACHRTYLAEDRVAPSHAHFLAHVGDGPVPLLPLPTGGDTLDRLAPLVRGAVLPLYPRALQGPDASHGDPAAELAGVRAMWRR
jgi:hypothetical protein